MNSSSLPWQRAWITGAGRGIGRALALALSAQGVHVYASARSVDQLQALQAAASDHPGRIECCPVDIQDAEAVKQLLGGWQREQCFPELCVLQAGTHDPFSAYEFSAARAQALLNINLYGTLNCIEPVLQHYLQDGHEHAEAAKAHRKGSESPRRQLAVMASVAGYRGLPTAAAYGAGKAALINLCEALKLDLTGSGIHLQVINPGFVRTPLTDKNEFAMPALLEPEDAAQRVIRGLLSNRFEISFPARFVYWLKWLRLLPYKVYFPLVAKLTGVK